MGERVEFPDVLLAEAREIDRRRDEAGVGRDEPRPIGLALSGGGIRSATFSLGVLQALDQAGIFKSFDYLSTVSGGGFIGSALSAWFARRSRGGPDFPFRAGTDDGESEELTWLRNHSDYLTPGEPLDLFLLPAHLIRGFLFNLLLLLPYLMLAAFLTEVVYDIVGGYVEQAVPWLAKGEPVRRLLPLTPLAFFLLFVVLYSFTSKESRRRWWQRGMQISLLAVAVVVLLLVLRAAMRGVLALARMENGWMWAVGAALGVLLFLILPLPERLSGLRDKLALVGAGLVVPAFLFLLYVALCVWVGVNTANPVEPPVEFSTDATVEKVEPVAGESEAPAASWRIDGPGGTALVECVGDDRGSLLPGFLPAGGGDDPGRPADPVDQQEIRRARRIEIYAAEPGQVAEFVRGVDLEGDAAGPEPESPVTPPDRAPDSPPREPAGTDDPEPADDCIVELVDRKAYVRPPLGGGPPLLDGELREVTYFLAAFLIFGGMHFLGRWRRVDANLLSWHGFYRNRISQAYALGDLRLSELDSVDAGGPYHLINTTLNAPATKDPTLGRRGVDFFLLSRLFVGGRSTGYCPTQEFQGLDPNLTLGSAVAISAAAASPIMGSYTLWPLVFSLTLLNVRLNYWTPSPGFVAAGEAERLHGASTKYLMNEALGRVDGAGKMVNLSDGGHVENLGLYELLRRSCRVIVVVDAEEDEELTFAALGKLAQFARIDLGVEIDIPDLKRIRRRDKDGWSGRHWALGTILYSNRRQGRLLYIKASMTGDEGPGALARAVRTAFPHESTADQSFSEAQFEAYRSLGEHIGERAVAELKETPGVELESLFPTFRDPKGMGF